MNYKITIHENFKKEFKPLAKKFPSLKSDLQKTVDNLENELALAKDLENGFKKINLKIKSKGKGSSGGGRIITYEALISVDHKELFFCSIYDKTDYESISIPVLKENLGL